MLQLIDPGFMAGIGMLVVLAATTLWILQKRKTERRAVALFVAVLLFHVLAVSFIYFADFQPLSGGQGDYGSYHKTAERISYHFWQGDLVVGVQERGAGHYYPVVVAVVYSLLFPSMVIGQLFNAWLAALAMLFLYFIVRELGGSSRWAFAIGLIGGAYPSFLFYASLLLKDVVVVLFVLISLLLILKLLRQFSWQYFSLLYLALLILTNFRFYIGIIIIGTFLLSWLLFTRLEWRTRLSYGVVIFFLLGFVPTLTSSAGYLGLKAVLEYANEKQVSFYKEKVYSPNVVLEKLAAQKKEETFVPLHNEPVQEVRSEKKEEVLVQEEGKAKQEERKQEDTPSQTDPPELVGYSSSVDLSISFENPVAFATTFTKSFLFVVVGPYPWQFTASRHYFILLEMIPWYFLLFFIGRGVVRSFKRDPRVLTLLIFSVALLALLALFFSNFGITTRIRISAFIALLPFIPLAFESIKQRTRE